MRVVHYPSSFSPLSQTFIYDYVTAMDGEGVECHVLTARRESPLERPFARVHQTVVPGRWHPRRLWNAALARLPGTRRHDHNWALQRRSAEAWIRQLAPDVIHAHFGTAGAVVEPVARRLGVPLVVTFYGYDASQLLEEAIWRDAFRALWAYASYVVVLSRDMERRLVAAGCPAEKVAVVRLGKDLTRFRFRLPHRPVERYVSVGRLVEKKGHLDLIMAVHRLRRDGVPVELEIVGDGPLRPDLEAYIGRNDLGGVVTLAGALPHEDAVERMAAADAFALCSRTAASGDQEGTPTVLLEAQALGLPCVSTRHAGIPEIVPAANHWLLADEGDVDGIAACMGRLARRPVTELEEMAVAGRALMEREFGLAAQVDALLRLYEQAVGGRAPRDPVSRPSG